MDTRRRGPSWNHGYLGATEPSTTRRGACLRPGMAATPKNTFTCCHFIMPDCGNAATKLNYLSPFHRSTVCATRHSDAHSLRSEDWTLLDALSQCGTEKPYPTMSPHHKRYFGDPFSLTERASRSLPFFRTAPVLHKLARASERAGIPVKDPRTPFTLDHLCLGERYPLFLT